MGMDVRNYIFKKVRFAMKKMIDFAVVLFSHMVIFTMLRNCIFKKLQFAMKKMIDSAMVRLNRFLEA